MPEERAFASGGNKYYVIDRGRYMTVKRVGWLGRETVGEVHDLEEAFAMIRADSGESRIEAR
jgi:hypothetical protein